MFILIHSLLYQPIHHPSTPPCLSPRPREKCTSGSLESSKDHGIRKLPAWLDSVSPKWHPLSTGLVSDKQPTHTRTHGTMNMVAEWRWHGGQLQIAPLQGTFNRAKLITMTNGTATHCKVPGWNISCMAAHSPQERCTPPSLLTGGNRISGGSVPLLYHNYWW